MEKVVVFDLDGTLLNSKNEIIGGKETIARLTNLRRKGYRLAICTGRLDHDIVKINDRFALAINERISQNGAVLYINNNVWATILNKDTALEIYDFIKRFKVRIEMNTISNRYWQKDRDPDFPKELYDSSFIKADFENIIPYQPVVLFLIVGEYNQLKKIQEQINKRFKDTDAIITSQTSLEVVSKGISKGSAIKKLYKDCQVYAIGDSESDQAMAEYATKFYYSGNDQKEGFIQVKDILAALTLIDEEDSRS